MRFWRRKISSNSLLMALLHSSNRRVLLLFWVVSKKEEYTESSLSSDCHCRSSVAREGVATSTEISNTSSCLALGTIPIVWSIVGTKGAILCSRSSIFHLQYTPQLTDHISSTALAKRRERTFTKTISLVSWNSKGRSQPRRVCTPTKNSIKLGRQCDALLILQLADVYNCCWISSSSSYVPSVEEWGSKCRGVNKKSDNAIATNKGIGGRRNCREKRAIACCCCC